MVMSLMRVRDGLMSSPVSGMRDIQYKFILTLKVIVEKNFWLLHFLASGVVVREKTSIWG